jgi:hypothetical protein
MRANLPPLNVHCSSSIKYIMAILSAPVDSAYDSLLTVCRKYHSPKML